MTIRREKRGRGEKPDDTRDAFLKPDRWSRDQGGVLFFFGGGQGMYEQQVVRFGSVHGAVHGIISFTQVDGAPPRPKHNGGVKKPL